MDIVENIAERLYKGGNMENLKIYNLLKEVPKEAQSKIKGGRLAGMTDIKPMWRIEKLTETFGPVGIGWYTETTKKEIIEGSNGEKIATVDILLYVKIGDEWSKGIEGSGGSSFVAKEKNGMYTSDECFKMAYTDALSVACKMLGMGASVYWGDSKYYQAKTIETEKDARELEITFGKHNGKTIGQLYDNGEEKYLTWLFDNTKDENIKKAISILTGLAEATPEETKEIVKDMPIQETQKQQLKDKFKEDLGELQLEIANLGKLKLSQLTYEEANKILEG